MRQVAILGTASSTLGQAPVNDPAWEIWACSPGLMDRLPRWDRWIEIHRPDVLRSHSPAFCDWLAKQTKPIYTLDAVPEWPSSVLYPRGEIVARFSDWFLTSTIAWMLALAIHEGPDRIGVWGVDMAVDGEYADQKAGCLHFIRMAVAHGIDVVIPPASELLKTGKPYPEQFEDPAMQAVTARKVALQVRLAAIRSEIALLQKAEQRADGALEEVAAIERQMNGLR